MRVGRQRVLNEGALSRHIPELAHCRDLGHRAGHQNALDAVLSGQVDQSFRLRHRDVPGVQVDVRVIGHQLQDLIQFRSRRTFDGDANTTVELFGLEFWINSLRGTKSPSTL